MAMPYEQKFAALLQLCHDAVRDETGILTLPRPQALGETYEEVIESLYRIAEAGLAVRIAPRSE